MSSGTAKTAGWTSRTFISCSDGFTRYSTANAAAAPGARRRPRAYAYKKSPPVARITVCAITSGMAPA